MSSRVLYSSSELSPPGNPMSVSSLISSQPVPVGSLLRKLSAHTFRSPIPTASTQTTSVVGPFHLNVLRNFGPDSTAFPC